MRKFPFVALAGLAGYALVKSQPQVSERLASGVRKPMDAVGFLAYATMVGRRLPEKEILVAVSKELLPARRGQPASEDTPGWLPPPVEEPPLLEVQPETLMGGLEAEALVEAVGVGSLLVAG